MQDKIIRAIAADSQIRAFFASTKQVAETARQIHNTTPVATAALGRFLTAALLMGQTLKDDDELLTLRIKSEGPLGGMLVTSSNNGFVKGYVINPEADVPNINPTKLNVGGCVGEGSLTVIKDMGLKEPYVGQIPLVSGEIAEDIANYFAQSEQIPSVVSLGVLVDTDRTVKQSGGFIIQLLPFASDEIITKLEKKINSLKNITQMLDSGMTAEDILQEVLGDFGVQVTDEKPVSFKCDCSRERVLKVLASMGREDLTKIYEEDKHAEIVCHFCCKKYDFGEKEIENLLRQDV